MHFSRYERELARCLAGRHVPQLHLPLSVRAEAAKTAGGRNRLRDGPAIGAEGDPAFEFLPIGVGAQPMEDAARLQLDQLELDLLRHRVRCFSRRGQEHPPRHHLAVGAEHHARAGRRDAERLRERGWVWDQSRRSATEGQQSCVPGVAQVDRTDFRILESSQRLDRSRRPEDLLAQEGQVERGATIAFGLLPKGFGLITLALLVLEASLLGLEAALLGLSVQGFGEIGIRFGEIGIRFGEIGISPEQRGGLEGEIPPDAEEDHGQHRQTDQARSRRRSADALPETLRDPRRAGTDRLVAKESLEVIGEVAR